VTSEPARRRLAAAWEARLFEGVRMLGPDETAVAGCGFLPEDSEANTYYEVAHGPVKNGRAPRHRGAVVRGAKRGN
jgi:hypothetical protein